MCFLCCDIYKWLDILVFSDKDKKHRPHHTTLPLFWFFWDIKEPTHVCKELVGGVHPGGVVQPYLGWVGNEGVDNNIGTLVLFHPLSPCWVTKANSKSNLMAQIVKPSIWRFCITTTEHDTKIAWLFKPRGMGFSISWLSRFSHDYGKPGVFLGELSTSKTSSDS